MEKKDLIAALKNKYKNLGLTEQAIATLAAYLEPTTTEDNLETALSGVEPLLKAFQSDTDRLRTDKANAEKALAAVKEQLGLNGGGDPNKKDTTKDKDNHTDDTPEWAKSLADSVKTLAERITTMEGDKVVLSRKQQLDAIVGNLPESYRKAYAHIAVKDMSDEDFAALKDTIAAEVGEIDTAEASKVVTFAQPKGSNTGGKKEASDKEVADVMAHINF